MSRVTTNLFSTIRRENRVCASSIELCDFRGEEDAYYWLHVPSTLALRHECESLAADLHWALECAIDGDVYESEAAMEAFHMRSSWTADNYGLNVEAVEDYVDAICRNIRL